MELISINSLIEVFSVYKDLIFWFGSISFFVFIFSLISIKWLVAWYLILILKNLVGYSLILGGIVMLVLPGQGLFTIIIGLILSNYPGKYSIEKKFIAIPKILKSINWLRKKSNKPPIKII